MGFLQRLPFLRPYQSDSERSELSFVVQREARSDSISGLIVVRRSFSAERGLLFRAIIRCLARDSNIVRMALAHAGSGNLHELRMLQLLQVMRAHLAHTRAKSAHQLIDGLAHAAFVGHATSKPFRH